MPPQNTPNPLQVPTEYDFIMNNQGSPKRSISSRPKLLIILAGVGVGLTLLIILLSSLLGGGSDSSKQLLIVMQNQQKIIQISETAAEKAQTSQTKATAATAKSVMLSYQVRLKELLASGGTKVNEKMLSQVPDEQAKQKLTDAEQSGRFDTTYNQLLIEQLKIYQQSLGTAYNSGVGPQTQSLLDEAYASAALLLGSSR